MNTPNSVDQYSRFMVDLFDERSVIGVSTGFQAFFGDPAQGSRTVFSPNSLVVEIDIIRGNEKIAALIHRGGLSARNIDSKDASDQKFSSFSRVFPLGEETSTISADQLNNRIAGENAYAQMDKAARLRALASNNHQEHIRRYTRMFEVLAAQSILTGKMDAILGTTNVDLQYDFQRNAANTFTVGTAWDQGAATIMSDIDAGCDIGRENGKITMDMGVLGGEAMEAMISNVSFQAKSDNRRFELIQISSNNPVPAKFKKFVDSGFNARGLLRTAKGYELWLFTYIDGYTAAGNIFTKFMPEDKMLLASSQARADRYFGPDENMPMAGARLDLVANSFGIANPATQSMPNIKGKGIITPEMFYYDAYPHHEGKGVVTRTQTAPIFATTMTDAFVVLEGLIT